MIESSAEKKKIFYMIVLILTFITMIIGATLAYFLLIASQKEEGTVLYTGKLEINYIDGTYVKDAELMPVSNVTYNTYEGVYRNNFRVASSGTLNQTISVDLEVTLNEFSQNVLRYGIFNDKGQVINTGYVPKTGSITLASNMFLAHDGIANYTLIIWMNNGSYNQNKEMGNKIVGKINIYSVQTRY